MLSGRLSMKYQDNIGRHSLVGDDDFLTTVDDEVATLIKHALLGLLGNIQIVHAFEVAEVGANHDRSLPKEHIDSLEVFDFIELASLPCVCIIFCVLLLHLFALISNNYS